MTPEQRQDMDEKLKWAWVDFNRDLVVMKAKETVVGYEPNLRKKAAQSAAIYTALMMKWNCT